MSTTIAMSASFTGSQHKKSVPLGTQIYGQDNDIPPREKTQAERLFERIGTGRDRALRRPSNAMLDRQLRRLIADANQTGDCIINTGDGYFRPGEDDEDAFEEYIAKERHRAREILRKARRMEEAFNRRYEKQ